MELQRTRYGYALKIDTGEEIIETLTSFASAEGVRAGMISGLGAVQEAELGFFVRSTGAYTRRAFQGEFEIVSLTGNFSDLEGRPFPHCHMILSGEDFVPYAGHLFRAIVSVTCEAQVITDPGALRRVRRADLGFNPLELGPQKSNRDGSARARPIGE